MEYKETFIFYESYMKTYERLRKLDVNKADLYIYSLMQYGLYNELPEQDSEVWLYGFDGVVATINAAKANRAKRINVPKEELEQMINEGKTQEEISQYFGCSLPTIQRRMKDYGLTIYNKKKVDF